MVAGNVQEHVDATVRRDPGLGDELDTAPDIRS
jgi:hypothetical protein